MVMSLRSLAPAFLIAAAVGLVSGLARADVPPIDACNSTDVGKTCNNAGQQGTQAGVCTTTTCTKYLPGTDGGTTTYACTLCLPPGDGGSAGATGDGGAKKSSGSDGGGCSVSGAHTDSTAGLLLGLGLVGLAFRRRRS